VFVRLGLILSFALLAVAGAIVFLAAVQDVQGRGSAPEVVVRSYFMALEDGDLDAALQMIEPTARATSADFVANLLGNDYQVLGVAVRQASILDRLRGEPTGPRDATIFLAITQAVDGFRWEAAPRVPLVWRDERWYLARPPLAD
jgi:hypothetical protein